MDGVGDQFLAGAGLALDEDGDVAAEHAAHLVAYRLDLRIAGHQAGQRADAGQRTLISGIALRRARAVEGEDAHRPPRARADPHAAQHRRARGQRQAQRNVALRHRLIEHVLDAVAKQHGKGVRAQIGQAASQHRAGAAVGRDEFAVGRKADDAFT